MNLSAVAGLPCRPLTAVWYRAVDPRFLPTALSYSHARLYPSRYYGGPSLSPAFHVVYFAETPELALFEVAAQFGSPLIPGGLIANPARSWLIINAQVQLTKVVDLTDVNGSHVPLSTTAQELTGDWKHYQVRSSASSVQAPVGIAPTQELGAALHADGSFEGFLTISAKLPYQMVLGVFPGRIISGNFIRYNYVDSAGQTQIFQIP
jgi:RES domain-containing protein